MLGREVVEIFGKWNGMVDAEDVLVGLCFFFILDNGVVVLRGDT